jgi:hypothetical protein
MCSNTNNANSVEGGKRVVLELLGHSPRNEITRRADASLHVLLNRLLADITFEAHLNCTKDVRKRLVCLTNGAKENENLMSGCVREQQ